MTFPADPMFGFRAKKGRSFRARSEHELGLTELGNFDGLDFRSFFYDADSSYRDCT